jgi:outer membrane lipoprotein-sorting protein
MRLRVAGMALIGLVLSILGCVTKGDATPLAGGTTLTPAFSVDEILDALDARGESLRDFVASVKLTHTDKGTGESSAVAGTVYFQKKGEGDGRIRVVFNKKIEDEKIRPQNHQYVLDGGWLIERDYDAKIETRRQVKQPGEKMDPMKLGEGPFPLPIGQKKEDVKKLFDVKKIDPAKDDPPGTVHVQLTPKPGTQFAHKFAMIDVWVDLADAMPKRIQTQDTNVDAPDVKTTELNDVKIDTGLGDKDFAQENLPSDWTSTSHPFQDE